MPVISMQKKYWTETQVLVGIGRPIWVIRVWCSILRTTWYCWRIRLLDCTVYGLFSDRI